MAHKPSAIQFLNWNQGLQYSDLAKRYSTMRWCTLPALLTSLKHGRMYSICTIIAVAYHYQMWPTAPKKINTLLDTLTLPMMDFRRTHIPWGLDGRSGWGLCCPFRERTGIHNGPPYHLRAPNPTSTRTSRHYGSSPCLSLVYLHRRSSRSMDHFVRLRSYSSSFVWTSVGLTSLHTAYSPESTRSRRKNVSLFFSSHSYPVEASFGAPFVRSTIDSFLKNRPFVHNVIHSEHKHAGKEICL